MKSIQFKLRSWLPSTLINSTNEILAPPRLGLRIQIRMDPNKTELLHHYFTSCEVHLVVMVTNEIITKDDFANFMQKCVFLSHRIRIQTFLKSETERSVANPGVQSDFLPRIRHPGSGISFFRIPDPTQSLVPIFWVKNT
jgi:hypothetical protein